MPHHDRPASAVPASGDEERTRYACASRMLDSPSLLGRLGAEAGELDPSAPPAARVLAGSARLRHAARVGVFAGSFNPLTEAHAALARAARAQAGLDVIVWLCATRTVDKERVERAALPDRLAQLVAYACAATAAAVALTNRGLYVDEARALRPVLAPHAQLSVLVGFDKIVQILDPRYYVDRDAALRALFAEANVLVAPRAGAGREALTALLARPENRPFGDRVAYLAVAPQHADDSSTAARQLSADARWDDVRALVVPEAYALARETGAYGRDSGEEATRYAVRERWLAALSRLDPRARRTLPGLRELPRATGVPDARGAALRAWLDAVSRDSSVPPPPLDNERG